MAELVQALASFAAVIADNGFDNYSYDNHNGAVPVPVLDSVDAVLVGDAGGADVGQAGRQGEDEEG
jgi:hypothetical protein